MSSLGNVLPFDERPRRPAAGSGDEATTTAAPRVRRSAAETANTGDSFEFSGNNTASANRTSCCADLNDLCDWIEPVGWLCVDEEDRKFAVWTEEDCDLIHPDDIRIYQKRYDAWLNSKQQAANALVRNH